MSHFKGFDAESDSLVRLPGRFFTDLLPQLTHREDLQLLLYMFWHLEQQEGKIRFFRQEDLSTDPSLVEMIGGQAALLEALTRLVTSGAVLEAENPWLEERYYFINGPQGRAAFEAIEKGQWRQSPTRSRPIHLTRERPNIFKLYEENIGPITPMVAEILKEDEAAYPETWIEEAIRIAVTRNARNWKYVQAILERWQKEGRGNEKNRRDDSQDPSSYRESWFGKD
jgi:DnaD/phage-associated family protein